MADKLEFASFLSQPEPEEQLQDVEQQETVEGVTDDATSQELPETPVEAEAVETDEQVEPSPVARVTFEDRLRAAGTEIPEDVDPADLYDNAIERIAAGKQAMAEAEKLRAELEAYRAQQSQATQSVPAAPLTPSPTPETEQAEASQARLFKSLTAPDASLNQYISRSESGFAIPKPEYGQAGLDAAAAINGYEKAEQEQAQLLLRDPNALIRENMSEFEKLAQEKAEKIVEARFARFQEEQEARAAQQQKESQERTLQQQDDAWHEANKAKIFRLGPDGEPLSLFDDGRPATTPTGRLFLERLKSLRQELPPGTPEISLRNIALREAELQAPAQPAAPAPVQTQAQKKEQFINQRQPVVPNQNTPMASASEAVAHTRKINFAEMIRKDPNNLDTVSNW